MTGVGTGNESAGTKQDIPSESTPFNRSMMALLEKVEYRRCDSGEDIEAICRLRYDAFVPAGVIDPNPTRLYADDYDYSPNAFTFGVYFEGRLASTLRIHHITKEAPFGPAMRMFSDVIQPMLDRGETIVHPCQFAALPEVTSLALAMPYLTMRLTVVANSYFKSTKCAGVIREEHASFYERIFEAQRIGEPRQFPYFNPWLSLFMSDRAISSERILARFPFLRSSPVEQRMLFQRPGLGEQSPLTILPTAKYIREAA